MSNLEQLVLLKSTDNSCLVEAALNFHQKVNVNEDILFLAHREESFLKESFESLKLTMSEFDGMYTKVRSMFLRDSWIVLDEMYGKSFFINEIQNIMKDEDCSTLCFYRLDTMFDSMTSRDCERLVSDIVESAKYYHKKVLFSINNQTKLGQVIENILINLIDIEYEIGILNDGCKFIERRAKNDLVNLFLLSSSDELIDFHSSILKDDKNLQLNSAKVLNEKSQKYLEECDVLIYNLNDNKLKDKLLAYIKNQNLQIKFIHISGEKNIRKRDLIQQVSNGVYQVFSKGFDLSEYIYTLEKLFRRKFYSNIDEFSDFSGLKSIYVDINEFKNSIVKLERQRIFYSAVVVDYDSVESLGRSVLENCIRDLDTVYHSRSAHRLIFIMIEILPSEAAALLGRRLASLNIKIKSGNSFSASQFAYHLGIENQPTEVV
jgi:hypothetical protein